MLEAALVRGLTEGGIDVVQIGMGPSPMLYFATHYLDVDGGIQVTGSHNPADYNGFKLLLKGRSVFGQEIQEIGQRAAAGDWSEGSGTVEEVDIREAYVDRLLEGLLGQGVPHRLGRRQRRRGAGSRHAGRPLAGPASRHLHRGRRHASRTTIPIRRSRRTSQTSRSSSSASSSTSGSLSTATATGSARSTARAA